MKHSKLILTAILAFILGMGNLAIAAEGMPMTDKRVNLADSAMPMTDSHADYTPVLVAWSFTRPKKGDKRYRHGWDVIHYVAHESNDAMLDSTIRADRVPVDKRTAKKKETALHIAASAGHETIVKSLIGFRADPNAKNIWGKTPLHKAAAAGHRKVVEMLLRAGARIDAPDVDKKTPMHQAAQAGKTRMVKLLARKGANINAKDKEGMTPARLALEHGKHHPAAALINDLGADKSFLITSTLHDWTLLHHAAGNNLPKLAKAVIALGKTGVGVDDEDYFKRTALHHAAWVGSHDVAKILVDNGADIHAKDQTNDSPIATAVRQFGRLSEIAVVMRRKQHQDWLRECNKKWKGNQFMLFFTCIEFDPVLSG